MRVDLHCHLLPGVDDGAKTLDQALSMARIAVADGITDIIATPHHLNGVYQNPASSILTACQTLQAALDDENIPLTVHPGAENHLVPELLSGLRDGSVMTLGHRGRYLLVELPVMTIPVGTEQFLQAFLKQGLIPIIAHPERNDALRRDPKRLAQWVAFGVLAQVTAQSLTGQFGAEVKRAAQTMVEQGTIHCVASDAHRDKRRIPVLSEAHQTLSKTIGKDAAHYLVDEAPKALLLGQALDLADHADALRLGATVSARPAARTSMDQATRGQSQRGQGSWWRRWLGF